VVEVKVKVTDSSGSWWVWGPVEHVAVDPPFI